MGNKLGNRRNSAAESSNGRKKKSSGPRRSKSSAGSTLIAEAPCDSSHRDNKKVISCPDLSHGGAVPYKFEEDHTIDVKIYRSYSDVATDSSTSDPKRRIRVISQDGPTPGIKVYRRSTGALLPQQGAFEGASQTLPRSFGRSRNAILSSPQRNGTLPTEKGGITEPLLRQRHSALGYSSGSLSRGSTRRPASTFSVTSIGYKVTVDDFPSGVNIRRKLKQFESSFVRTLTDLYSSLTETTQLGLVSIAICPDRANQQYTLWQYLNSQEQLPLDLNAEDPRQRHILTIPDYLYASIKNVRKEHVTDQEVWLARGREVLTSLAVEAANEISRIFEYQIALLSDGFPIELLARHGAECVFEYLKRTGRYLDRNSIVHGVVRGLPRKTGPTSPKVSVLIGEKELKWALHEIFKLPGLRKDLFLMSNDIQVDDDRSPWKFYVCSESDPGLYGYRGLMVDWDFASSAYRLNGEDEATFTDETEWQPEDFHRQYATYRRLIGLQVMQDFCRQRATSDQGESPNRTSLVDFVKQIQGETYIRDEIQVVYRPLDGSDAEMPCLERVNLGGADITRVPIRHKSNARTPVKHVTRTRVEDTTLSTTRAQVECYENNRCEHSPGDTRTVTITLSAVKKFFDTESGTHLSNPVDDSSRNVESTTDNGVNWAQPCNGDNESRSPFSSSVENSPAFSANESRDICQNGDDEGGNETVVESSVMNDSVDGDVVWSVTELTRKTVTSDV